jgi:hypothetical protein
MHVLELEPSAPYQFDSSTFRGDDGGDDYR